jgi:predicted nucleic acid-binding protein
MNAAGILLDTSPLVALLSKNDAGHARAERLFSECLPPFRCCEAVVTEACFLMRRVHAAGPAEVIALGRKGVYEISLSLEDHWTNIETLLQKYANRPISLADACLIRCAEIYEEARILTFDSDFGLYRWARNKKFQGF